MKFFTNNWLWIEICENVGFSKIDITMTKIDKKIESDKSPILRNVDQLLKIQHQELKVWCLANNLRKKKNNSVRLNSTEMKMYFKP